MARKKKYDVDLEEQPEDIPQEVIDEALEEQQEDAQDDQYDLSQEQQEAYYGDANPDELMNQHAFIHRAAFDSPDTVKTTFLNEYELGRPLFSVRFLLDLHDITKFYLDPVCRELKLDPSSRNRIALYFWEKIQNVTSSGMSNEGFSMKLNVTKKIDTVRKRVREESMENLKQNRR